MRLSRSSHPDMKILAFLLLILATHARAQDVNTSLIEYYLCAESRKANAETAPDFNISGTALDSESRPVAGAAVKLLQWTPNGSVEGAFALSDANGKFTLSGKVKWWSRWRMEVFAPGYAASFLDNIFARSQPYNIGPIYLFRPVSVRGKVINDRGVPVANAVLPRNTIIPISADREILYVFVHNPQMPSMGCLAIRDSWNQFTNNSSNVEKVDARNWRIAWTKPSTQTNEREFREIVAIAPDGARSQIKKYDVNDSSGRVVANLQFDHSKRVRGRVVDAEDQPVPNATVELGTYLSDRIPIAVTKTDAQGNFTFPSAGKNHCSLFVWTPEWCTPSPVELDEKVDFEKVITRLRQTPRVTGILRIDSKPARDTTFIIVPASRRMYSFDRRPFAIIPKRPATPADGGYRNLQLEFPTPKPKSWDWYIDRPDLKPAAFYNINISSEVFK